ncbi:unnamed protein product [Phaeothamnion confervicola]
MMFFRILFGIDAIVAVTALYFFGIGLSDGSVSSFNILLWLAILGGIAAILGVGLRLNSLGRRGSANGVLLILALPGFLCGLLLLGMIILQPRWN